MIATIPDTFENILEDLRLILYPSSSSDAGSSQ